MAFWNTALAFRPPYASGFAEEPATPADPDDPRRRDQSEPQWPDLDEEGRAAYLRIRGNDPSKPDYEIANRLALKEGERVRKAREAAAARAGAAEGGEADSLGLTRRPIAADFDGSGIVAPVRQAVQVADNGGYGPADGPMQDPHFRAMMAYMQAEAAKPFPSGEEAEATAAVGRQPYPQQPYPQQPYTQQPGAYDRYGRQGDSGGVSQDYPQRRGPGSPPYAGFAAPLGLTRGPIRFGAEDGVADLQARAPAQVAVNGGFFFGDTPAAVPGAGAPGLPANLSAPAATNPFEPPPKSQFEQDLDAIKAATFGPARRHYGAPQGLRPDLAGPIDTGQSVRPMPPQTGLQANIAAGANEAVAGFLGAPVDLATFVLNRIPGVEIAEPFAGSASITRGLRSLGIRMGADVAPASTVEALARAGARASGDVLLGLVGTGALRAPPTARATPAPYVEALPIERANYAQSWYSEPFSTHKEATFRGLTINDVRDRLLSGEFQPSDVPIHYVISETGQPLIVNTRSAQALIRAGIPRSRWATEDKTGDIIVESRVRDQLTYNKLGPDGTPTVVTEREFKR